MNPYQAAQEALDIIPLRDLEPYLQKYISQRKANPIFVKGCN